MRSNIWGAFVNDVSKNFPNVSPIKSLLLNRKSRFLLTFRIANQLYSNRNVLLFKILHKTIVIYYNCLQRLYCCEIPERTKIGGGVFLPHLNGIVINPEVEIGSNCTILHQVTIGNNIYKGLNELAKIGDDVHIGVGAKIIGPCKIGDGVVIGANSVVTKDVLNGQIVAGVPAKEIPRSPSRKV